MRLIDADKLLKEFPIRINHYDKENGDFRYVLGIEAVMDYAKEMPTVEAIPITWIEKWQGKQYCLQDEGKAKTTVIEMLADWEEENGLS